MSANEDSAEITDTESLTKDVEDSHYLTLPGSRLGTVPYMSPEQVQAKVLDARSDLFSCGVVFYEMATGTLPFDGAIAADILKAILTRNPTPITRLNATLSPKLESVINKCLQKEQKSAISICRDTSRGTAGGTRSFENESRTFELDAHRRGNDSGYYGGNSRVVYTRSPRALDETDTVVLAEFTNKSADPVFEETLREGFESQLRQSPFLSLVPEQRIQQELQLMGVAPDTKLSSKMESELCQRLGSKAYLGGSISSIGTQYVIGVRAVNCQTGGSIAQEQVAADSKETVLSALGAATTKLRKQLGESLKTIQKLNTPIEQATTPSLDALQAYSLGRATMVTKADYAAAIPLLEHSVRLDPNFAMAYATLGVLYTNLGEEILAAENTRKAYELRTRVSEWERFYIESHYFDLVTGDLEKARPVYEMWGQIYPREMVVPTNLGVIYERLGEYDKSLAQYLEAQRRSADSLSYANLVAGYLHLNRLGEARPQLTRVLRLERIMVRYAPYSIKSLFWRTMRMGWRNKWPGPKANREMRTACCTSRLAPPRTTASLLLPVNFLARRWRLRAVWAKRRRPQTTNP